MLSISCFLLVAFWQISDSFKGATRKLRNRDEALTTTEWALLVAGAAAIAIAVVAVVRRETGDAVNRIKTEVDVSETLATSPPTTA